MTSGLVKEKDLEKQFQKQMGCMAGFLQIFDRHHVLAGKRFHSAKRLPPSPVDHTNSELGKSTSASPAISMDLGKQTPPERVSTPRPERQKQTSMVADLPPKSFLPLPILNGNRSSRNFSKETPRLSLDSRATTDSKGGLHPKSIVNRGNSLIDDTTDGGQQRRSPSVIAMLMGLEPLPNSSVSVPEISPALRRSASESRVSKDLFQSRFVSEGTNLHPKQQNQSYYEDTASIRAHYADPRSNPLEKSIKVEGMKGGFVNSTSRWRAPQPRRSFFDSGDVFPEPKQTVTIYAEIEKRLKMRGIDEPSKDLETLKQILEAMQLKGLLHCKPPLVSQQNHLRHRNFVYDESPIVLMKPTRSSASTPINRRLGNGNNYSPSNVRNQVRGVRRSYSETSPSPSPRKERNSWSPARSGNQPTRSIGGNANTTRSNSPVKPRALNVDTQRRVNEPPENRKASPVHSPKLNTRKTGSSRSDGTPKSKKATSEINQKEIFNTTEDDCSSNCESSITTSTDTEKSKAEEYKEGKNLLERCNKLLHSIAEMAATDMQPSPVSVLDSSFYKDESLTPSPVTTKRNIDFKDYGESEGEIWSPIVSPIGSKRLETPDDYDFIYVSDILRVSHYLPEGSDVFLLLEKQQYLKGNNASRVSRLQRKLIFDTINEILDRNKRLPPWKYSTAPPLDKVWTEYQKIRERDSGEDLFETICRILKKDLDGDGINGWGDCAVEMSEAVLDIERLIFKDVICEIIGDVLSSSSSMMPRRKLIF